MKGDGKRFLLGLGLWLGVGWAPLLAQEPAGEALWQEFRRFLLQGRPLGPVRAFPLTSFDLGWQRVERVTFETEPKEPAVALIQFPIPQPQASPRRPAVIVQHWLGAHKDHPLLQLLIQPLVRQGFLTLAIDGRFRGERGGGRSLSQALIEAFRTGKGHPLFIDTAYDLLRAVDYLQSRPDVDPERIGVVGVSEGGFEAWMAAVADLRLKAVVSIIGVTRFQAMMGEKDTATFREQRALFEDVYRELAKDLRQREITPEVVRRVWERLLPGAWDRFDPVRLVPLLAPRPLLILAHEKDQLVPFSGTLEVYQAALARYKEQGHPERIQLRVAPGLDHYGQDPKEIEAAVGWFNRWLGALPEDLRTEALQRPAEATSHTSPAPNP